MKKFLAVSKWVSVFACTFVVDFCMSELIGERIVDAWFADYDN